MNESTDNLGGDSHALNWLLGKRGAKSRVQKYVAILADASAAGVSPQEMAGQAVALVGMKRDARRADRRQDN